MKGVAAGLVVLLVLRSFFFRYAAEAPSATGMTGVDEIGEIRPLIEAYESAMLAGGAEGVISLYASDGVEMVPGAYRTRSDMVRRTRALLRP